MRFTKQARCLRSAVSSSSQRWTPLPARGGQRLPRAGSPAVQQHPPARVIPRVPTRVSANAHKGSTAVLTEPRRVAGGGVEDRAGLEQLERSARRSQGRPGEERATLPVAHRVKRARRFTRLVEAFPLRVSLSPSLQSQLLSRKLIPRSTTSLMIRMLSRSSSALKPMPATEPDGRHGHLCGPGRDGASRRCSPRSWTCGFQSSRP